MLLPGETHVAPTRVFLHMRRQKRVFHLEDLGSFEDQIPTGESKYGRQQAGPSERN